MRFCCSCLFCEVLMKSIGRALVERQHSQNISLNRSMDSLQSCLGGVVKMMMHSLGIDVCFTPSNIPQNVPLLTRDGL